MQVKPVHFLLAILTVLLVLWIGHTRTVEAAVPAPRPATPTASAVTLTPSTVRSLNTLPQALLGHWMKDDNRVQVYFGESKVVVVTQLQRDGQVQGDNQTANTYKQAMPYDINAVNEERNLLNLRLATRSGWAQNRLLHFSSDRQSFTEHLSILGHAFSTSWHYVDEQQLPPLSQF